MRESQQVPLPCAYCGCAPEQRTEDITGYWRRVSELSHQLICVTPECAGLRTRKYLTYGSAVRRWNQSVYQATRIMRNAIRTAPPLFRSGA